jgi:uncharacterized repeat protein (TIGR03803 family)
MLPLCLGAVLGLAESPVTASGARTVVLYRFSGGLDGGSPRGPLVADPSGNLYGVAEWGGGANAGVIFELSPPVGMGGAWTETVLHSFSRRAGGFGPMPGLTLDSAGNLFGTTFDGGNCPSDCGVAFELSPPSRRGGRWGFSVIHTFAGPTFGDGGGPAGSLARDAAGNLYGATHLGGDVACVNFAGPCGTVFRLSPPASRGGAWTVTVLYSFKGLPDGAAPSTPVVLDAHGNVYGTTSEGGTGRCTDGEGLTIGCGTAFVLSPSGSGKWTETVVHNFGPAQQSPNGFGFDRSDALFGSANYLLFELVPPRTQGGRWGERVLHQFVEGISGTISGSVQVPDGKGNFFGTTVTSGLTGFGTVYELSPPTVRGGAWSVTTLVRFSGGLDSNQPYGGVILGSDGSLYGTASNLGSTRGGVVFQTTP